MARPVRTQRRNARPRRSRTCNLRDVARTPEITGGYRRSAVALWRLARDPRPAFWASKWPPSGWSYGIPPGRHADRPRQVESQERRSADRRSPRASPEQASPPEVAGERGDPGTRGRRVIGAGKQARRPSNGASCPHVCRVGRGCRRGRRRRPRHRAPHGSHVQLQLVLGRRLAFHRPIPGPLGSSRSGFCPCLSDQLRRSSTSFGFAAP